MTPTVIGAAIDRRRMLLTATTAATAVALVAAATAPVDPGWEPTLVTAGAVEVQLAGDGADTVLAAVTYAAESGSATQLWRSDDGGASFAPSGAPRPVGTAELRMSGDTVLLREYARTEVSLDGGRTFSRPSHLQDALVSLDADGGVWWSPRSTDACAGAAAFLAAEGLGTVARSVRLPDGLRPTQSFLPGPGTGVVATVEDCVSGARRVVASNDDGASWHDMGATSAGYETVASKVAGMAFTADGTVAVVEGVDGRVLLVTFPTGGGAPQVRAHQLPASDGLGLPGEGRVDDISIGGDEVVVATGAGLVAVATLDRGTLGRFTVVRDGAGTALEGAAVLTGDGSLLARVDTVAVERLVGDAR